MIEGNRQRYQAVPAFNHFKAFRSPMTVDEDENEPPIRFGLISRLNSLLTCLVPLGESNNFHCWRSDMKTITPTCIPDQEARQEDAAQGRSPNESAELGRELQRLEQAEQARQERARMHQSAAQPIEREEFFDDRIESPKELSRLASGDALLIVGGRLAHTFRKVPQAIGGIKNVGRNSSIESPSS